MAQAESLSLFADDDFAWEEPGFVAAAQAATLEIAAPAPARRRRSRQTRTFAGDLARLEQALGLSPLALLAVLIAVIAAAAGIRVLGSGDEPADSAKTTAPTSPPRGPAPGTGAKPAIEKVVTPKTFEKGDTGPGVRDLQAALSALGFYSGALDGGYGPGTESSISARFSPSRGSRQTESPARRRPQPSASSPASGAAATPRTRRQGSPRRSTQAV